MSFRRNWLPVLIVALAFLVRVWALEWKPPHFDEGVNGLFVDEMRRVPAYHYDPGNFHGPLHFYALFTSSQFFGRGIWALRIVTVLVGTATVALMFAFRRFFPEFVVTVAAVATAISPGMVFYSRYAIHESWMPPFMMLAVLGGMGIAAGERRIRDLWCVGAGLAGMLLTKETYVLHIAAAGAAWLAGRRMFPSPVAERTRPATLFGVDTPADTEDEVAAKSVAWFPRNEVLLVAGVCGGVVVAFYSGLFYYWRGVLGIFETFIPMARKGWTSSEGGHHKELLYFVKLLGTYEWPAFAGLLLAPLYAFRRSWRAGAIAFSVGLLLAICGWFWTAGQPVTVHPYHAIEPVLKTAGIPWSNAVSLGACLMVIGLAWAVAIPLACPRMRFLALFGLAGVAAYSLISYKTPWCVITLLWPFYFLVGHLFDRMRVQSDSRLVVVLGGTVVLASALDTHRINFADPTNGAEPYIYVQQLRDIELLAKPVEKLIAKYPWRREITGQIIYTTPQPLPWAMPEVAKITMQNHEGAIQFGDSDFILVHESRVAEVEAQLLDVYFRSRFRCYNPDENHQLYLRATVFQEFMEPGRIPEYHRRIPLDAQEDESR